MSDIALKISEFGFDLAVTNGDFEQDEGLETAVCLSLFTDRRVTDDQLPHGETDKRGYWADKFSDAPGDLMGSRLWTLQREKRSTEVLRRAEDFVKEALNWLIEDGVASAITATATTRVDDPARWDIAIEIQKPKGRTSRFQVLWDKQILKGMS